MAHNHSQTQRRRNRRALLVSAWLIGGALLAELALAAAAPLPRLPKTVWDLYLPEEYDACGVAYGLYARLPEADRAKLHAGAKVPLEASALTRDQRRAVAAWFNSVRWGCDPPAERIEADGIRRSTLVFKCEESVVEFCLRSPQKTIWKKLTIACAPERAEWVKDGLPLLPYWAFEWWRGGFYPPKPIIWVKAHEHMWYLAKATHAIYASLPADRLRELHQSRELGVRLADLSPSQQEGLAEAIDFLRLSRNQNFNSPLDNGRPPDAVERRFGIEEVRFYYGRSIPDDPAYIVEGLTIGVKEPGVHACPRPYRVVMARMETPYPPSTPARRTWTRHACVVAGPLELQKSILAWKRLYDEWNERWAGRWEAAPPAPRHPPE